MTQTPSSGDFMFDHVATTKSAPSKSASHFVDSVFSKLRHFVDALSKTNLLFYRMDVPTPPPKIKRILWILSKHICNDSDQLLAATFSDDPMHILHVQGMLNQWASSGQVISIAAAFFGGNTVTCDSLIFKLRFRIGQFVAWQQDSGVRCLFAEVCKGATNKQFAFSFVFGGCSFQIRCVCVYTEETNLKARMAFKQLFFTELELPRGI